MDFARRSFQAEDSGYFWCEAVSIHGENHLSLLVPCVGRQHWWPLEPSPGPLSGWAVMDAETPRQRCIHEPLWGVHSVESCGVQNISVGQQHWDNHGEASQWPWGDWFVSCSIWHWCSTVSSHPKSSCISNTSKDPLWCQALGDTELRADRLLGVK